MATSALVLLIPIIIVLCIIVYFDVGGPFFKQKRVGKNENIFYLVKFKSMKNVDKTKNLVSNTERITQFGKFIRNASLDELPSLINIIKGDMSIVGPRPLLVEYLPCYKTEHRVRHNVKPGLTGLAQVNGRNNTTWQKRLDLDAYYVKNQSLWLDLKIILLTVKKVLVREGVESDTDLSIVRLDQDKSYLNS